MAEDFDKREEDVVDSEIQEDHKIKYCSLCRRSERQAGKLVELPNNLCICSDCMQKSF
ncbi:MAG: ATP-dependent Clp protease ATP-binding subunit ClpX, partial [Blautia sp.]|nr:ATP-dependent Clp protease ATP-binding subunit ClpX [Blautia sp.]